MDIYYAAFELGQERLAAAARHKAKQCDEELMFSGISILLEQVVGVCLTSIYYCCLLLLVLEGSYEITSIVC